MNQINRKTSVQRVVFIVVLVCLVIIGAMGAAHASRIDLNFIESEEELTAAFDADTKGEIGSIAINQSFFLRVQAKQSHEYEH